MTEAELLKRVAAAEGDCALGSRSVSASQLDAYKLAGLVALSKDLGYDGSQRLNDEVINPELQPSSVERRQKSLRRSPSDASSSTASSSADAGEPGPDGQQRGRVAAPSTTELVEVLRSMLCGDDATPQRSGSGWKIAAATTGLAVTVVGAVEDLYRELGVPKGQSR